MGIGQRQYGLKRAVCAFAGDRRGNVAMMWGITAAVLIGMIGLAVDFTRAQTMRTRLQNAADGAALVAERSSNLTMAQRTDAARAFFEAEMGDFAGDATFTVTQVDTGGHRVNASMPMPVSLARIIKNEDWEINVASEAQAQASPPIEVVLALDNTGSMSNDMDTLREGAEDLAQFLLSLDGDTVSVGLVPFVAQVNIGTQNAAWVDQTGVNPYNGAMLEGRYLGYRATSNGAASGNCTGANYPTTYGGFAVRWIKGAAANPSAYQNTSRCYAFAPADVNMWSLYANLPNNAQWGGCVEMRPPPYDISDHAAVVGTPGTMWVPYFSLDDGGNVGSPANNWITSTTYDTNNPIGATSFTSAGSNVNRTLSVYKYRSGVPVSVDTSNTNGRGPNRGCPTPIVPLTSNDNIVINAIRDMVHWNGGGTNQVEGLAWAWRVISPGAPFTEGRPYNDPDDPVRKVIVLFTDGDNTSLDNNNAILRSDYAGFGYRSLFSTYQSTQAPTVSGSTVTWGPGVPAGSQISGITNTSSTVVNHFDARQRLLCQAIRAQNIEIYAIGFDIAAGGAAEQLLQDCVTPDGTHYYRADNQQDLLNAFAAIGTGIGQLRLTH